MKTDLRQTFRDSLDGLLHLFWPQTCSACGSALVAGEDWLCWSCGLRLPRADSHLDVEAPVARRFWGRVELEQVCCRWRMKGQGGVRNLLHRIKYQGQSETGRIAGRAYGELLAAMPFSEDWDALVPVPMSMSKQRKRAYNQAVCIAEGLAEALEKPIVMDLLERREEGKSQTQKNRFDRWEAVQSLYAAGSGLSKYEGTHLVLVDDVITTGATVEACASVLKRAGFRVSVIALATVD